MSTPFKILLSIFFCTSLSCAAQNESEKKANSGTQEPEIGVLQMPAETTKNSIRIGDSVLIIIANCKSTGVSIFPHLQKEIAKSEKTKDIKTPFIQVHGNILYNFSYRSYIDTPFAQNDLQQHLVQTSLNFLIDNRYPVKMTITNRSSNSPYFKNSTDVNLQFNRSQVLNNIKADLRNKAGQLVHTDQLQSIEKLNTQKQQYAQQLQNWVNSPARVQELVEEKERAIHDQQFGTKVNTGMNLPSINADKLSELTGGKEHKKNFEKLINPAEDAALKAKAAPVLGAKDKLEQKKKELAAVQQEIKKYSSDAKKLKKTVTDSINLIKKEINSLTTTEGLYGFMKRNGIAKKELTTAQRVLLSINQIGIGRSWVDYSELTVKNISLAGVNIEANPSPFYFAVAAGKVNYRFRDFVIKDNKTLPGQSLYLVRAGIGQKEKNNLIFTFYNGKKAVLNYTASNDPASVQRVLGISAETRLALNANNYIIAEVAKSSFSNAGTQPASSELVDKAFNFKVRSNEAFSIKLYSQNPQTNTRITGYYRKTGKDFQSFNLYPINVNQDAWMARVSQNFWKNKLNIDAAIRKNDFVSPIAAPNFSTQTIFKSLQASLRIPKYPFVSVGYYPSSQLSLSNNNVLTENQYNTLNVVANHSYRIGKTTMNTNTMFTKFYNNSSDSGFIYFNASSWTVNHSIFLSPFMLQSSAGVTVQKDLNLLSLEQLLSYQYKNIITLSGSLKYNRLNHAQTLLGCTAGMGIVIKKLGTIQLNYDKTYLPAYNNTLRPVDMGRVMFYREF